MEPRRRSNIYMKALILFWVGVSILLAGPVLAADVDFPTRQVVLVVPFPAGGASSVAVNILLEGLARHYTKPYPFVPDHRPGAAGLIGTTYFMNQPADGHTLVWFPGDTWVNMVKQRDTLGFSSKDFVFIRFFGYNAFVVAVPEKSPFKTFKDYIDYAKKNPEVLTISHSGIGSGTHLTVAMLMDKAGIKLTAVPFSGGGPSTVAMLGGHVASAMQGLGTLSTQLKAKQCRALVLFDSKRDPQFPEVPTAKELGYDIDYVSDQALLAKKGTPEPVVDYLRDLFKRIGNDPKVRENLEKAGFVLYGEMSPEEVKERVDKKFEVIRTYLEKLGLVKK
jgi:tripartite-type tricarboxylate transporter receptor subunit TctC